MTVLLLLIFASLALAGAFLGAFIWAVRSGQFEDTCTPSMRVLTEERTGEGDRNEKATLEPIAHHLQIPLTPALSQRERENSCQTVGESGATQFQSRLAAIHPLPLGEGRGEGNSDCAATKSCLFQAPTISSTNH